MKLLTQPTSKNEDYQIEQHDYTIHKLPNLGIAIN